MAAAPALTSASAVEPTAVVMSVEQSFYVWRKEGEPDVLMHYIEMGFKKDASMEYIVNIDALRVHIQAKDPQCSFQLFPQPAAVDTRVPPKKRKVAHVLEDRRFIYSSLVVETPTSRVVVSCRNGIHVHSLVSKSEAEHLYHKWLNRATLYALVLNRDQLDTRAITSGEHMRRNSLTDRGFAPVFKQGILKKQGQQPMYFRAFYPLPIMPQSLYQALFKQYLPGSAVSYNQQHDYTKAVLGPSQTTVIAMTNGSIWCVRNVPNMRHVENFLENILLKIKSLAAQEAGRTRTA